MKYESYFKTVDPASRGFRPLLNRLPLFSWAFRYVKYESHCESQCESHLFLACESYARRVISSGDAPRLRLVSCLYVCARWKGSVSRGSSRDLRGVRQLSVVDALPYDSTTLLN